MTSGRSKFAYLSYDDMIQKLKDGVLDEFDRVIVTDENFKEYIITPDLIPVPLTGAEDDPTVPEWAKQVNKPTYNANEVGAVDANNKITFDQIDAYFDAVFGGN